MLRITWTAMDEIDEACSICRNDFIYVTVVLTTVIEILQH